MPVATDIVDVHAAQTPLGATPGDVDNGVPAAILSGLSRSTHNRTLPTLLLYTETGLRIYDELTTKAAEYYLFGAEEGVLKERGGEIIRAMHPRGCVEGESIVELGAGQVISPPPSPPPHTHASCPTLSVSAVCWDCLCPQPAFLDWDAIPLMNRYQ